MLLGEFFLSCKFITDCSAVYFAMFMKHIGHTWYLIHMGAMLLTCLLTVMSIIYVFINKHSTHFFSSTHAVIVFLILDLRAFDVVGSFVSNCSRFCN
jgi:hypothetical protein